MKSRTLNAAGLVCEMVGVIMLFFWAWPQPAFETEEFMVSGAHPDEVKVLSQKRWHSARALGGLGFIFIGYGLQLWVVLVHGRPVFAPPQSKPSDGNE